MELEERIQLLANLGQNLLENTETYESVLHKAKRKNPWFTIENQKRSIQAIANSYLKEENLNKWVELYRKENFSSESKNIGVICAGNIPLVGIHDLIAVFISGHKALLKLSSKDEELMKLIVNILCESDSRCKEFIKILPMLKGHEAVIATGSNNSARYFEYYFRNVPLLLRKNRTSVAIIDGSETDDELKALGDDVFAYFGLGCRNVSKLFIPEQYEVSKVFESFQYLSELKNHHKYANNFDYNLALYLMNQDKHFANDFFIMKEDESLFSRLAVLHFERYKDREVLNLKLNEAAVDIQCIVGNSESCIPFGKAQSPDLWDYADGVDTLRFLTEEI